VLASIVTILIILARTPSAIKAGDEATFHRLLRVLAFVSPVASFAVSIAFVVGSGGKLPTDNPIFSSYFGLFVIAVLAVVVFARVITTLARMPSDIKAEDEAALMARFAASTARTVNKFLDCIPSSRDLTSLQGFAVWCIQARGWDSSRAAEGEACRQAQAFVQQTLRILRPDLNDEQLEQAASAPRPPAVSAFPERVVGSACASSFSRLARRLLALRPAHSRCHRISWHANQRLQPLRYLHDCSGCFRLERLPGGICTHLKAPPLHGAHPSRTRVAASPRLSSTSTIPDIA
jgi:hypothetical protein